MLECVQHGCRFIQRQADKNKLSDGTQNHFYHACLEIGRAAWLERCPAVRKEGAETERRSVVTCAGRGIAAAARSGGSMAADRTPTASSLWFGWKCRHMRQMLGCAEVYTWVLHDMWPEQDRHMCSASCW